MTLNQVPIHQATGDDRIKNPWHLWLIGVLSLLWNCGGAFDYVMTETRNATYLSAFTPEQLAYFQAFPKWAVATWAISVWGGVFGSFLLLLRSLWAVPVLGVSLASMAPTFFYNYVLSHGYRVMGGAGALAFTGAIVLVGVGLLLYARKLRQNGVLR